MTKLAGLITLPRLRIQNANAVSGPLSWGFPAPSAFTGFAHALARQFPELARGLTGVGILCHQFEAQVAGGNGFHPHTFRLTRNPLKADGSSPALVEEGRMHLEISLVLGYSGYLAQSEGDWLAEDLMQHTLGMRLAGGSLLPQRPGKAYAARWHLLPDIQADRETYFRRLRQRLMPGFALVHRPDILAAHLHSLQGTAPEASVLDALLDLSRLNIEPAGPNPQMPEETLWQVRRRPGWLVPLPIGYAGISPLYAPGSIANSRDPAQPFRFVEAIYSLGEWISPHRITQPEHLLWHHQSDPDTGIYTCCNPFSDATALTKE